MSAKGRSLIDALLPLVERDFVRYQLSKVLPKEEVETLMALIPDDDLPGIVEAHYEAVTGERD